MIRFVVALIALGSFGCDAALECIVDSDCAPEQYCAETQCRSTVPKEDRDTAYLTQVRPLLNAGCSCHQEIHARPWSFSATSESPDILSRDLGELAIWAYDPRSSMEDNNPISTILGYGLAQCGFAHPGVFPNADAPHSVLIERFLKESETLEVPGGDTTEDAPLSVEARDRLPPLEQQVVVDITASEPDAFRDHILPRVIGQCGCCHRDDGARGWRIPITVSSSDEALELARGSILSLWSRTSPENSQFVSFGLGRGGGQTRHPKVYRDANDPRLQLLIKWVSLLPDEPSVTDDQVMDPEAPDGQDGG